MMQSIYARRAPASARTGTRLREFLLAILLLAAPILAGTIAAPGAAEAKTPGRTYCYKRVCHRVKTIAETRREIGKRRVVYASHYDSCERDRFNPCGLTSSGERFRPNAPDNAASPIYPDGTRLLVWNPANGRTLVVRINNAGPYWRRRMLDLSRGAAEKLGFRRRGVAKLHVKVLSAPTRTEARYRRNRRYAPVPGYVGSFQSIDTALLSVGRAIAGLFGSPVHAIAGRTPPSARSIRIARRQNRRRQRLNRRLARREAQRLRRLARLTPPPLPIAKATMIIRPTLQIASAEYRLDQNINGPDIVLPTRPPLPPLPIASVRRPSAEARRLAARAQQRRRRVAALRRRAAAHRAPARLRLAQAKAAQARRSPSKLARLARAPISASKRAAPRRSKQTRLALAKIALKKPGKRTTVAPPRHSRKRPAASKRRTETAAKITRPKVNTKPATKRLQKAIAQRPPPKAKAHDASPSGKAVRPRAEPSTKVALPRAAPASTAKAQPKKTARLAGRAGRPTWLEVVARGSRE